MAGLAVLAVSATLALPSVSGLLDRHRLAAAAEALAADLREARFEAARNGQALHLQSQHGSAAGWCWTISRAPGCGCGEAGTAAVCSLKTVHAVEHPGISLLQPLRATLEPLGQAGEVVRTELESRQGHRLRVELAALGRSHICTPDPTGAAVNGRYPRC
jgi:type IV fimbrial biogenesis protein FimT